MAGMLAPTSPRGLTVWGLAVGAIGIATLWASGVDFPFYPPPGLLILAAGAVFVALVRQTWAPAVGAFLGLFVIVGFVASSVASGAGTDNLTGDAGAGGVIGTVIQLIGVGAALVAGVAATRRERRAG
ncbi:hypothetical protein [Phytohabitans aurantiacus]|uniref:Major facilitator superfamily (MFS) profile domain-containing protein n=1 Tax=Phytohabitans aurantiacus TaxID=3016789 RepID=A0ABQ5R051_9ACTN|nr:hypothetical protein [Phytohabitans aurantiacus]GLI00189.1 hypothetical protein Pa4123_54650 [Phytohabitans aurantiacus]